MYKEHETNIRTSVFCVVLVSLPWIILIGRLFSKLPIDWFEWIPVLFWDILISPWAWKWFFIDTRECEIKDSGIWVKYFGTKGKIIKWEDLQQINICYKLAVRQHIPPVTTDYEIICFVTKRAKKDYWGYWNIYSIFSFRKVLFVEYTKENFEKIKEVCSYPIVDLRETKLYSGYKIPYVKRIK